MTGYMRSATEVDAFIDTPVLDLDDPVGIMNEKDIYKELKLRGYHYKYSYKYA